MNFVPVFLCPEESCNICHRMMSFMLAYIDNPGSEMKRLMMIAMTSVLALSGCAATDTAQQRQAAHTMDREDAPLGSLIKRKPGSTGPQNTAQVDLQQLENARNMGSATVGDGK